MGVPVLRMVIAYDVSDDRRRTRVAEALQAYGERVQYSVFVVDGRSAQFVRLERRLEFLIDPDQDSVLMCLLGPKESATRERMRYLGVRRRITGDDAALVF